MKLNNMHKLLLILGLTFILPYTAKSQVTFKAEAPNVVSVGEKFKFVITTTKRGKITRPEFKPAFEDLGTTQKQLTNIYNDQMEQSFSLEITLLALKEGTFTIGEATLIDDEDNTYKTKPVSIEVIKGQSQQQKNDTKTDLFMRFIPSRTSLYHGDNLTLTLKMYVGLETRFSSLQSVNLPAFDNFWAKDITVNNPPWQRENVDGTIYNTIVLKTWTLNPQKSGTLRIGAADAECVIEIARHPNFLFAYDYDYVKKNIRTSALTINVKDMPAGAPSSFSGAVGSFSMQASLSKDKVTANDAVNLNIKISGNGNHSLITIPNVKFPPDFDTYDSKKTVSGNSLTFEVPFIPRSAGTFTIEPVLFSYFDPVAGTYKTLMSNPMIIEVEKDMNASQQVTFVNPTNQRDVKILASDIRFIKNNADTWYAKGSRFLGMKHLYPLYIIAIVVFALIYLLLYKRNKNSQNIVLVRNRKAKRIAKKRLNMAAKAMNQNNASTFYDEILKAVWGYLGDKFSLPVAELSRNNVSELLEEKNVDKTNIEQLIGIVNECEFARYAPGGNSSQMSTIYNSTIEIISKLEQKPNNLLWKRR